MNGPEKAGGLVGAVLIAGPTASGKSALALETARREGRAIVNADSMQVYGVLRVLTARPSDAELIEGPHHLYGHVPPATPYSVGAWVADVRRLAEAGAFAAAPPVFVGGTGLYFRALCEGLADIPAVAPDIRARWRRRLDAEGAEALHRALSHRDPRGAAVLRASDGQRIVRALEVHDGTGRSILDWQARAEPPVVDPASARKIVLDADRAVLNARIEARFEAMIEAGALDEVRQLKALGLAPDLPAMKAIGVPQLMRHLSGAVGLREAAADATAASRRYAKRQATWFRHQLGEGWERRVVA